MRWTKLGTITADTAAGGRMKVIRPPLGGGKGACTMNINPRKAAIWCPLTGVTLQVSETPADIASAVSAGDFFLSHAPLVVD